MISLRSTGIQAVAQDGQSQESDPRGGIWVIGSAPTGPDEWKHAVPDQSDAHRPAYSPNGGNWMPGHNKTISGGGFHHIAMRVRDFDASLKFYTEGLGFEPKS